MDENKNILSAADMDAELGVGCLFIYRELRSGRIPSRKIGDRYFLSRSAWEKFLSGPDAVEVKREADKVS